MSQSICKVCGCLHDEETGGPDQVVPPGTPWELVPAEWRCPLCDVEKDEFESV